MFVTWFSAINLLDWLNVLTVALMVLCVSLVQLSIVFLPCHSLCHF